MNFSIIIPAYNEEESIGKTLESLLNQTLKPHQIIVVDDGSSDKTAEIVSKIAKSHPNLQLIEKKEKGEHLPGGKVVRTFNVGLPFLSESTEIICKFDADLIFPEDYLAVLDAHYRTDPSLGMCGGFCYVERDGQWVIENLTNADHLRGAVKSYRKKCFEDIGGLKLAMGWDTADELLARYHGWRVKTDASLCVKHLRPTGAGYGERAKYLQGSVFYRLRYGWVLSLLASAKLALKKKSIRKFGNYLKGYWKAKREKQPYLLTEEEGKWVRQYRWKGIFSRFSGK